MTPCAPAVDVPAAVDLSQLERDRGSYVQNSDEGARLGDVIEVEPRRGSDERRRRAAELGATARSRTTKATARPSGAFEPAE
jgi:hypothetical protein